MSIELLLNKPVVVSNRRLAGNFQELDIPYVGRYGSACCAVGNKIYIYGGYTLAGAYLAELLCYDTSNNSWTKLADAPFAHRYSAMGHVNGKLYVYGGFDGSARSRLQEYDIASNTWTYLTATGNVAYTHAAASFPDRIYFQGGFNSTTFRQDLNSFKPPSTWNTLAAGARVRWHTLDNLSGKLYSVGGWSTANSFSTQGVRRYDTATNVWKVVTNLINGGRRGHVSGVVNGRLYIFSGIGDTSSNRHFDLLEFSPGSNTVLQVASHTRCTYYGCGAATDYGFFSFFGIDPVTGEYPAKVVKIT